MQNNFLFTQSSLKELEKETTCPSRWKGTYVDKLWRRIPTLSMLKGSYFEQLFLGSGATDEIVNDLPRKKNGEKTADQIRIEEQAELARTLFDPHSEKWLGYYITRTQLKVTEGDREGTIDIEASDRDGNIWLIDVKLTGDLSSTWGDYAWGLGYEHLDLIQLPHYQDLYFKKFGIKPQIALFIADYSTKKRIEFNEVIITEQKLNDYDVRFKKGREVYNSYCETGFPVEPSPKECGTCQLECKFRII